MSVLFDLAARHKLDLRRKEATDEWHLKRGFDDLAVVHPRHPRGPLIEVGRRRLEVSVADKRTLVLRDRVPADHPSSKKRRPSPNRGAGLAWYVRGGLSRGGLWRARIQLPGFDQDLRLRAGLLGTQKLLDPRGSQIASIEVTGSREDVAVHATIADGLDAVSRYGDALLISMVVTLVRAMGFGPVGTWGPGNDMHWAHGGWGGGDGGGGHGGGGHHH